MAYKYRKNDRLVLRLCNEMLALAVATHGAGDLIAAIC